MSLPGHLLLLAGTGVLATLLASFYRQRALARSLLDHPGDRSSHDVPTPSGGGVAWVAALVVGVLAAIPGGSAWDGSYVAILSAGVLLSVVGWWDDAYTLPIRHRLAAYGVLALAMAALLVTFPPALSAPLRLASLLVTAFALLWLINLYNFMDGIDGLAATQTALAATTAALFAWFYLGDPQYVLFCLLLAAANLGFLALNWAPARLFMGDAGSIAAGFLLGALALRAAAIAPPMLVVWLIMLAVFITDATLTLLWRMATGQPFTRPHRQHAYQRLARHWRGHAPVVLLLLAISSFWLLPLAWFSLLWPATAWLWLLLAYLPTAVGVVAVYRIT